MTKPEKERRTGENLGVQPKNLTLWEARQAVWRDLFAGLFYGETVLLRGGIFGGVDVEKQGRARM